MSAVRITRKRTFKTLSETGSEFSPEGPAQTFDLEVCIEGEVQTKTGMVMNIRDLDRIIALTLEPLEGKKISKTSAELAQDLFAKIRPSINFHNARLLKVRLSESADLWYDVWA